MKKILLLLTPLALLTSCVATHSGSLSSSSIGKNVKYEDVAIGVSQTDKYFGIGGVGQDALVLESKRKLILNRPLMANEEYSNFTLDFKNTYWPFYRQTKVTMSADVISYSKDSINDPYSDVYKHKLLDSKFKNELFAVGDTVIDKKLRQWKVISIENNDYVRVVYKTENNKIKSKKVLTSEIYSQKKGLNDLKPGEFYSKTYYQNAVETNIPLPIYAVGIKTILVKNNKGGINSIDIKTSQFYK